jgi:ABC-type branched-subunit amino acid transport system substrate-binding protein
MRRSLATIVAVVGLVTAATVATSGAATPAATRAATDGVTKDEIKIGITYPDLEAIRSVTNTDHGDYEKAYQAVIDDLNKKGGIDGRTLVPVFAKINPLGTAPAQEACIKLTEDEKVFAAMSFFNSDAPLCFVTSHDTPILGGQTTPEYLAKAKAPWATLESGAELGPRQIDALVKAGALKGKLGIVAIADEEQSQLKDVVLPALQRHELSGTTAIIDAPSSDPVLNVQQAGTIMERFKADGVKTVLLVGGSVAAVVDALSKSDYRPKLVATIARNLASAASDPAIDPSVVKTAVAADSGFIFSEPALKQCFKVVERATGHKIVENVPNGEPQYRVSAQTACEYVSLFSTLAKAAGKNLTVDSFEKAIDTTKTVSVTGLGTMTYQPKSHTYSLPMFLYRYDPGLKRLVAKQQIT